MQASPGQLSSQISETAQGSRPGGTNILRWPRNSSQVHVCCVNHNTFLALYFCLRRPEKKEEKSLHHRYQAAILKFEILRGGKNGTDGVCTDHRGQVPKNVWVSGIGV